MIVAANLDCEAVWAGAPLPAAVAARLALLATTMRVFAEEGDDLWVHAPVAAACIPDEPRPRLISGALPAGALVRRAWAADPRFAPADAAAIARRVNDRRFAAALARELGVALPGATIVESVDALAAHLAAGGADASPDGSWVAKSLWSAAGRDRVRRRGAALDEATRTRLARLLAVHGALAFEPWMPRLVDVGQGGDVAADGTVTLRPPHRGLVDAGGVVRGIALDGGAALEPAERDQLAAAARAAGQALAAASYAGPFVVDGFVHGDAGRRALHPMCELNARLTFGLVARAWADRLGAPITLGLGGPRPGGARPLVLDDTGAPAAWITLSAA